MEQEEENMNPKYQKDQIKLAYFIIYIFCQ